MLDRVTHRGDMKTELVTITRMLMGLPPAVAGDLPPPEEPAGEPAEAKDSAKEKAAG